MSNTMSMLDTLADDLKAPTPLPVGVWTVTFGSYKTDVDKDGKGVVVVNVMIVGPGADVSDEAFEAFGGYEAMHKTVLFHRFFEDRIYYLKQLITDILRLQIEPGATVLSLLLMLRGQSCFASVVHYNDKATGEARAQIRKFLPFEE